MMIFTHEKSFTCFMIKENFYRFYAVVTVRVFCVGHLAAQKKKKLVVRNKRSVSIHKQ